MFDRKIDSNYRVRIPKELLDKLNINEYLEAFISNKEIILKKSEKDSEVNLINSRKAIKKEKKIKLNKINSKFSAIEDSEEVKLNVEPIVNRCSKCVRQLKGSKFKLNGKLICRDCRNELRDQLIKEREE